MGRQLRARVGESARGKGWVGSLYATWERDQGGEANWRDMAWRRMEGKGEREGRVEGRGRGKVEWVGRKHPESRVVSAPWHVGH